MMSPHGSRTLSVVTACLPSASEHLRACADSVSRLRSDLPDIDVDWILALDGPGDVNVPQAVDQLIRLPVRRGVSTARNIALGATRGDYLANLDADDEIVAPGVAAALRELGDTSLGWVACNRLLTTGERTFHWHGRREWPVGSVAAEWSAPMAFHSNTLIARTELVRRVGGWPGLAACEDLALALRLGEVAHGRSVEDVLIRYRAWELQATKSSTFVQEQTQAYAYIESMINALRDSLGRPAISSPPPMGGKGAQPV